MTALFVFENYITANNIQGPKSDRTSAGLFQPSQKDDRHNVYVICDHNITLVEQNRTACILHPNVC